MITHPPARTLWFLTFLCVSIVSTTISSAQTTWVRKVAGNGLGNPFCVNPWNDNVIYGAVGGNVLYISRDRGNSWQILSVVSGGTAIKSVAVSASDTNIILVAQEAGPPDRIMKTTNNGATWYVTLQKNFYYWGVPLAYCSQCNNDTVYTMGNNIVYRSTNFGETWDSVRANPFGSSNQGWEYAVIRPDSPNVLIVADNTTGIWKTDDYGVTWRKTHSASAEVPALAIVKNTPNIIYAARWSGGGGFIKSTDGGENWTYSTPLNNINMWGVDVAKTYSNYVITGTFGPSLETTGGIYISRDAAGTWTRTSQGLLNALNYACLVLDTTSVFVLQGDGIYKLQYPSSLLLTSPNGGERWHANKYYSIQWNSTNVTTVRLDYTTDNGSTWLEIDNNVPAENASYLWLVPNTPSTLCRVRIQDTANSTVGDQSDTTFTIDYTYVQLIRPNGGEEFLAGTTESILWNAQDVSDVKLEFSTNNGLAWMEIETSFPASEKSYLWTVPDFPSPQCLVRISSTTDSSLTDVSDSFFTILNTAAFLCSLIVSDNGSENDTIAFGELIGATDGIDTSFGETELLPKPPPGTFDIRWRILATNGTMLDVRDLVGFSEPQRTFILELQPGLGGYPMTVRWNPNSLPLGKFIMRDELTHGESLTVNMRNDSLYIITNPAIASLEIVHFFISTVIVPVNNRWNIVSLPLRTEKTHKDSLFPTSVSHAFLFEKGYVAQDSLVPGYGYWLKFSGKTNIPLTGQPVLSDSFTVVAGWNLVGSISVSVPVAAITSEPPSIIASPFYGYNNGYYQTEIIEPGKGYWVKVTSKGKLILSIPPKR